MTRANEHNEKAVELAKVLARDFAEGDDGSFTYQTMEVDLGTDRISYTVAVEGAEWDVEITKRGMTPERVESFEEAWNNEDVSDK